MPTDTKAVTITSTSTAIPRRARVRGIYIVDTGTAGSVVLKDGGASGTTQLDIATLGSATATQDLQVPGRGIVFGTDVHATLTNVTSVTIFYE